MMARRHPHVLAACIVLALLSGWAGAATQYEAISVLPSAYAGEAFAISDSGNVAGGCRNLVTGSSCAFMWSKDGGLRLLTAPRSIDAFAFGVNDKGQVVGQWHDTSRMSHAAYWDASGTFYDLGIGGFYDINSSGMAVGNVGSTAGVWNMNGTPGLAVALSADTLCINEAGQVAGSKIFSGTLQQAFIWDSQSGMHARSSGNNPSEAWGINNLGWTAGNMATSRFSSYSLPCLWRPDGTVTSLGTLPGVVAGRAYSVNDSGVVVGGVSFGSYASAFVWTSQDGMRLLNGLGGNGSYATSINSAGQIVGYSTDSTGVQRAVLWNPVPEPSALVTVLSGIVGLGFLPASRRRFVSRASRKVPERLA
jgi:probable HAF family extracellular repeat protein